MSAADCDTTKKNSIIIHMQPEYGSAWCGRTILWFSAEAWSPVRGRRMQAREKIREFTTCDKCYREMHGGGKDAAKAEAGRCKQRAGNTTLR
jgi:hypothetical protein